MKSWEDMDQISALASNLRAYHCQDVLPKTCNIGAKMLDCHPADYIQQILDWKYQI